MRPPQIDALGRQLRRLLGRSLRLRQVSAGGCNGCEVEVNALGNVVFDAGRFGIEFVASPRHADGILVTGPVTAEYEGGAADTYEAVAEPKLVIAAGACAISGGFFRGHAEVCDGVEELLPVDLYVRAARRTRTRYSTGCCGCWAGADHTGGSHSPDRYPPVASMSAVGRLEPSDRGPPKVRNRHLLPVTCAPAKVP